MFIITERELYHYGVKGMKWGVRKDPVSMGGRFRRVAAGIYGLNERTYRKLGNNTLASMNASEKNRQLKKASEADRAKAIKQKAKQDVKLGKQVAKDNKYKVDTSKAKNATTKRVAEDTHKLSDKEFKAKYHTSKKTFAKRYERTKGDTYSLGRKKQAAAVAFLDRASGHSMKYTVADIVRYDTRSKATEKLVNKGHNFSAGILSAANDISMKNRKDWNNLYYMPQSARKKYGLPNK